MSLTTKYWGTIRKKNNKNSKDILWKRGSKTKKKEKQLSYVKNKNRHQINKVSLMPSEWEKHSCLQRKRLSIERNWPKRKDRNYWMILTKLGLNNSGTRKQGWQIMLEMRETTTSTLSNAKRMMRKEKEILKTREKMHLRITNSHLSTKWMRTMTKEKLSN